MVRYLVRNVLLNLGQLRGAHGKSAIALLPREFVYPVLMNPSGRNALDLRWRLSCKTQCGSEDLCGLRASRQSSHPFRVRSLIILRLTGLRSFYSLNPCLLSITPPAWQKVAVKFPVVQRQEDIRAGKAVRRKLKSDDSGNLKSRNPKY